MDEPVVRKQGTEPTFQLGLALAGAISAGAYTAGVLDFLFQALSEWENQRGQPATPRHRVVLKVIAGASAGGITGALGAIALARGLCPREFSSDERANFYRDRYDTHQRFQCVLPALYKTWVTLPAMISADGIGGLLAIDDLKSDAKKPVLRSLLNASLLDAIKRTAIESPEQGDMEVKPPVRFIAQRLHIYLTISNMRGIPFKVEFGRNSYGMQTIGDRIHYVVTDLGTENLSEPESWVECDAEGAGIAISVKSLPRHGGDLGEWDRYGTSALASGAFPIGLAPRQLNFPWSFYLRRRYPIPIPENVWVEPNFPPTTEQQSPDFVFQSVDGGLVNNNPFDYAQYALCGGAARDPVGGKTVDRAIVMVAPFPEPPELQPEGSPSPAVIGILKNLFPSLINQARFRTADLAPAFNERDFSRYLIAPLRRIPRLAPPAPASADLPFERFPIACGVLGGFGGFLDEKFRAHDFQLGRRNCQQFLRTSFLVPSDNIIVGRPESEAMLPIIPLLGDAADPVPLPLWPQITQSDFKRLSDRADERIGAVVPYLINSETSNVRLRLALRFGWRIFMRSRVTDFVHGTMLADLVRRGQIDEWNIPPEIAQLAEQHGGKCEDVQAILAELLHPAFDFRTPQSIAKATHLPEQFVNNMLQALTRPATPRRFRTWQEAGAYTFFKGRPGFLARRRIVKWFNNWWNAPNIS